MGESLDALVRRVDEDRWLASRFAPSGVRERLVAIYALTYEIARTSEVVSEAGIGAIRLAWWRDAIADLAAGKSPAHHPTLQALAATGGAATAEQALWNRMIEARAEEFSEAHFSSAEALETYLDATAGGTMRLALNACGAVLEEAVATQAARAWGMLSLVRARRAGSEPACAHDAMASAARGAYEAIRRGAGAAPSAAFPAIGYTALIPAHLRALSRDAPASLQHRQWTLVWASATGRI